MNTELFVIYFDYREYDPDFARTHVKNGLVEYKLNKKFKIYKQTSNIHLKIRKNS